MILNVMGGRACIRGMRITVALIVNLAANGMNTDEIIEAYPYLEPNDIQQALRWQIGGVRRAQRFSRDR